MKKYYIQCSKDTSLLHIINHHYTDIEQMDRIIVQNSVFQVQTFIRQEVQILQEAGNPVLHRVAKRRNQAPTY